jgi:hypothetical protein
VAAESDGSVLSGGVENEPNVLPEFENFDLVEGETTDRPSFQKRNY